MRIKFFKRFGKEITSNSNTTTTLDNWRDLRMRLFGEGVLVGLFSGSVVIFYRFLLENAEILRAKIYNILSLGNLWLICGWFILLTLIGCL